MEGLSLKNRKSSFVQEPTQKIIVGVAGGSAAGKTTLCENIFRQMAFDRNFKVEIISLDSFYNDIDKTIVSDVSQYNFDHPNALDFDLAFKTLQNLMDSNDIVEIPKYSFITHSRQQKSIKVGPANVIFFEGLMVFQDKRIRDLMTYKIFINCDDDIRLCRRLKRDTSERGRSVVGVLQQYNKFVKNAFRDFILPSIVYADIIIPGFRNNRVSVDFIVQHIKNMARKITFKQKAVKTKMFIFGDSDMYDLQYEVKNEYENQVSTGPQAFLIFPTSQEHKRELNFFMSALLSQIFSIQYFREVFSEQFVKVMKALLRQLISFKNFNLEQMEIISVYNIDEVVKMEVNKFPIKVIFYPVAASQHSKNILNQIRQFLEKHQNVTFIILNAFCDMNVPRMIYKFRLSNVILINLLIIANDKRFRQTLTNNLSSSTQNFDWFTQNREMAQIGCEVISKDCQIYQRNEMDIALSCYNHQISIQKNKMVERKIDQEKERFGNIFQHQVYCQQHQNLCGFHALSSILSIIYQSGLNSRDTFLRNYNVLANAIGKVGYKELERAHLQEILTGSDIFEGQDNIGVLIYSFKYLQSTDQQLDKLDDILEQYHNQKMKEIFIITGVVDHYALVRIHNQEIHYYDSLNISLLDIMNGTHQQLQKYEPEKDTTTTDYQNYQNRMQNSRQLFGIIRDLMENKKTTRQILIEKRIEDIVHSFNESKDILGGEQQWLKSSYPKPVLENDLFRILRERKLTVSPYHRDLMQQWLNCPTMKNIFNQDYLKLLQ